MKFEALGLNEKLLEALGYMGFKDPTPIQEQAIPAILEGKDLIATAQTGTGKTAAFLLPVLNKLVEKPVSTTNTLIICPTRELAVQIEQQIQALAYDLDIGSIAIYGGGDGSNFEQQKKALTLGGNIIVATPGKLVSHLNMGYVDFSNLEHFILDEADRMLDMGFVDDINKIMSFLPEKRQNLMFSATMDPKIRTLASKTLVDPVSINIAIAKPAENVKQFAYLVYNNQKSKLVKGLINANKQFESVIIFSSTKKGVSDIVRELKGNDYEVAGMSSDFDQKEREEVLLRFKAKKIRVLVATDVMSRGIDIKGIDAVFNYDVPNDAADYVHRIGRTGRADASGVAVTLINEDDMHKFHKIEQLIEKEIRKSPLPEVLGEGPKWNTSSKGGYGKSGYRKQHKGKKKK